MTAQTENAPSLLGELAEALAALDVDARVDGDRLVVDGNRLGLRQVHRAHPTPADLGALVAERPRRLPAVLVADRVSDAGRDVLRQAGWGWLDRRGHLRIWAPGVRIEAPVPDAGGTPRSNRSVNLWTTVGLEIAVASLCRPTEPVTARRVAAVIHRSVGATHELIARFVEQGLIGPKTHLPLLPDLFWELSARWPDDSWTGLPVPLEEVAERVGADQLVRVDERAATLGGARIAAVSELPARCYLRSDTALRRARGLGDRDRDRKVQSWVRRSPVDWLPLNDDHPADATHPWAVAHPIVCALRLAADESRGREIVDAWGIVPEAG